MIEDWSYELNKNREQKIRLLAKKLEQGNRFPIGGSDDQLPVSEKSTFSKWNDIHTEPKATKKRINVFLAQLVAASVLFFVTLLGIRYPTTEQWVKTVWNQTMPYDQLTAWYQEVVGSRPTLLPVFSEQKQDDSWIAPVKGKVVLSYNKQRKGVVIQTAGKVPVVAPRDGIVTFVGTKPGMGNTVIMKHESGEETWYGFLNKVTLKKNTKVKKGQTIGQVMERSNHYFVYIALQADGKFIDPIGIIPLG